MSDNRDDFTKWWDRTQGNYRGSAVHKAIARQAWEAQAAAHGDATRALVMERDNATLRADELEGGMQQIAELCGVMDIDGMIVADMVHLVRAKATYAEAAVKAGRWAIDLVTDWVTTDRYEAEEYNRALAILRPSGGDESCPRCSATSDAQAETKCKPEGDSCPMDGRGFAVRPLKPNDTDGPLYRVIRYLAAMKVMRPTRTTTSDGLGPLELQIADLEAVVDRMVRWWEARGESSQSQVPADLAAEAIDLLCQMFSVQGVVESMPHWIAELETEGPRFAAIIEAWRRGTGNAESHDDALAPGTYPGTYSDAFGNTKVVK